MSALNKTESQIWRQYELILTLATLELELYFSDRANGFWWDTVFIHEKGVLERVKEQQCFIERHIILVVQ